MTSRSRFSGSTIIWVAISATMLVAMVGVGADMGYLLWVASQLQNAADAAALAGAQRVRIDPVAAHQAAIDIALANSAAGEPVQLAANPNNDPDGDIVFGYFDSQSGEFVPSLASANAAKVVARRTDSSLGGPVPLFFGRIFGLNSTEISRSAIAVSGGGTGAGLIALNAEAPDALRIFGTGLLNVNGGAIQVNSDNSKALTAGGTILIDAPEINVGGEARFVGGSQFEGDLNPNSPPIPDPLKDLPPPVWDPAADLGEVRATGEALVECVPGYYSGGITANNGHVVLAPGIYILDGAGLNIAGNTDFFAEGVMFYIIGTGVVDLTGTGDVHVTPPDPTYSFPDAALYEGISIFQARDNTNDANIVGTNLLDLDGTLYFSSNHIDIGGTGDGFGNQLICDTVEINGTGEVVITYDGRFPAPGFKSWLVK